LTRSTDEWQSEEGYNRKQPFNAFGKASKEKDQAESTPPGFPSPTLGNKDQIAHQKRVWEAHSLCKSRFLEEATKRDLDCEQPQKLTIAAVGATCSDPAYVVRSPPGVFARGAGLSLGSGVASALRNHHNVAVEALAALHYASGKVAYTSPSAFGEAFEPSQDWRDAWETLTETSNSKAENLEGLVHRSPNQFIREKVEPAVKAFSKGFKKRGQAQVRGGTCTVYVKGGQSCWRVCEKQSKQTLQPWILDCVVEPCCLPRVQGSP
jgi:hypothetical protein